MKNKNDIVALNDSQILRWICELNGIENLDYEVSKLKRGIKFIKKQPKNKENKDKIKEFTYRLLMQKIFIYQRTILRIIQKDIT